MIFKKKYFGNTIQVSKGMDSDQARHFVEPDLDPNCLQGYQQMTLLGKDFKRSQFMRFCYGKHSKIANTFHFLQIKFMSSRMLVLIENREDPDLGLTVYLCLFRRQLVFEILEHLP